MAADRCHAQPEGGHFLPGVFIYITGLHFHLDMAGKAMAIAIFERS